MKTCPTCHQRIADKPALTTRVLALLASSDRPLAPKDIRASLGSAEGTTYQTLRRLAERGAIRKSTIHNVGTGWVLAEQGVPPQLPGLSASEMVEGREELEAILKDLVAYVGSVGRVPRDRASEYLQRMGAPVAVADDIIDVAIQGQMIEANEDWLVAP